MKIFKRIHLWLSVPFGIVISIICLTGAAMVCRSEIEELIHPELYRAECNAEEPLPIDSLVKVVSTRFEEEIDVKEISIPKNKKKAYKFRLSKPESKTIYVDQYSGKINGEYERCPFFSTMFKLHRWLLDQRPEKGEIFWGKMIVGVSTIVFALILISGIVIWWPKKASDLKKKLKINLRKGPGRFFYDLHVSAGFYFTLVLLASALTGLTWSFTWYRDALYGILIPKTESSVRKTVPQKRAKPDTLSYEAWANAYANVTEKADRIHSVTIYNGRVEVDPSSWGSNRHIDTYYFDAASGEISGTSLYKDMEWDRKVRGWVYTLHVGAWGGLFSKIITLLAMLVGASLPFTGYYIWIKRLVHKKRKRK